MNNQNIKIGVQIQSNTDKEATQAERLGAALKSAAATAQKIKVPAGATTGVQSVMQRSQPVGAQAVMQYGQQRGTAGATGAAARDFAAQQQGLGGLVRLYATYAANIYAAGAAFRALSEAMNTSNMVKGLDTLGAATGRNLGTLSKRLVEVSDGALSFRDAMEAVATTSAAGMTAKETEALTQVAKNASVALGKSMPDALNRLSRAVTKLEPELLDELGIMTKIGPAVDAYALKLGKASSQLTQAQRQQAFLNAVVKEGIEKFGELGDIAANPYDKLTASLKNTLQSGLEFVNKFVAPVVNLLAQSPTALITAIGAVGLALVKQALPALGEFKAGLAASANKATELAKQKRDDATAAQAAVNKIIQDQVEARANTEIEAVDAAEKRIVQLRQSSLSKQSVAYKILQKDIDDVTAKDLARLEKSAKRFDDRGLKDQADAYREVGRSIVAAQKAEEDVTRARLKARAEAEKEQKSPLSTVGIRQALATKAEESGIKKGIVSNAAYNASLVGVRGSWKLLNAEIDASNLKLGLFSRNLLLARGAFGIFIGVASTAGAVLSSVLGWVGLIVGAIGLLDAAFSSNSKESEKFSAALDKTKEAAEGAGRTIELVNKKGTTFAQSIEGVYALSNALQEVADSADGLTVASEKAKKSFTGWDKLKDRIASLFGGGVDKNLNKALSESVSSAFQLLSKSGLEDEAKEAFGKILNINNFDLKSIEEAFSKLSGSQKKEAEAALVRQSASLKESSDRLQSFKGAAEGSKKAYDEFIQSTANTNPLFKVGTSLELLAVEMQNLKTNGINELGAAFDLFSKKPEFAALFGKAFVDNLIVVRQEFLKTREALQQADAQLKQATVDAQKYKEETQNIDTSRFLAPGGAARRRVNERSDLSSANLQAAQELQQMSEVRRNAALSLNEASVRKGSALINSGITTAFQESARIIDVALGQSAAKAALSVAKARAGALYGVEKVQVEGKLALQELEVQKKAVNLNIELILSQERLIFALQSSQAATTAQAEATKAQSAQLKASDLQAKVQLTQEGSPERARAQEAANLAADEAKNIDKRAKALQDVADGLAAVTRVLDTVTLKNVTARGGIKSIGLSEKERAGLTEGARSQADLALIPIRSKVGQQLSTAEELTGAYKAKTIENTNAARDAEVRQRQTIATLTNEANKALTTQLGLSIALTGTTAKELIAKEEQKALGDLIQQQETDMLAKRGELAKAEATYSKNLEKGGGEGYRSAQVLKEEIALKEISNIQDQYNLKLGFRKKLLDFELDQIDKKLDKDKQSFEVTQQTSKLTLEYQTAQLSAYSELYGYSKKFNIEQQAFLDKKRIELEYTDKIGISQLELQAKRDAVKKRLESINVDSEPGMLGPDQLAEQNAILRELDLEQLRFDKQKQTADAQRTNQINTLAMTKMLSLEQERYNKTLEVATNLADSFSTVFENVADNVASAFEKMGKGIGGVVIAMTEMGVQSEKNAKAQETLNKKLDEAEKGDDVENLLSLRKEQAELQKKTQKDEISGYAKSIGAAKNMFKEKSGAYKILAAMEKAMYIAKLAMDIKEFAIKTGLLQAEVAATAATQGQIAAVENAGFMARLPKMITGIFGKFLQLLGPWGMAAAGVAIAAIGLSSSGGGKPSNFVPSAEQRQETQGTAMSWDTTQAYGSEGKKIQTREGVFGDTSAKSESIANSLEIIKNNSVAGLSYNDQLLKAFESLNNTMKDVAKSVYAVSGIRTGSAFGSVEGTKKSSGFLGIGAKSVEKEITDAGIQLKGTFLELARGTGGVINQFETLTTTTTKKGFLGIGGSTRVNVSTQFKDLDPKAAEAIGDALGQGYQTIMQAGIETGLSPERIDQLLSGVKVDELASLRGLKGEELQTELNAVIGSILDDAAGATFESFKQFREFGEGMLETVVRVIDTNKKVKQVLSNLSGSVQNVDFAMSEQMIKMAGGLEAFIEQSDSFSENFLTEQERLAPKQKAVRDELGRLGLSWVTTRKQFKDVVQSLIDTGQAGGQTYADLMKLNKNFAEITPEIENLSKSLEELKNDLKSAAEQRISDLKSARDGFEQFSKSIRDYQQSLKTGALSPLTPGQKYLENKRQFEQLSALAKTDTKEGADARGKLQGAASTLLESSRTMFASSDAYTQDFGSVQAALDSAAAYGDEQVKKANESIELVKQQVQGLVDLKDSIDRLPEPISAGVGSAVLAALAGVQGTQNPVEAIKAAEDAKAARDERAIAYAAESSAILKDVKDGFARFFGVSMGTKTTSAADAFAAAGNNYSSVTSGYTAAATTGSESILNAQPDAATWFSGQNWYMETGATGSNYIPEDMPLYVHQGERLMPAADNKQLMKMVSDYSGGGGGELYDEVCRLTKQVETLTKVVADGAILNAQATDRNTDEIAKSLQDTAEAAVYSAKLQNRTSIV